MANTITEESEDTEQTPFEKNLSLKLNDNNLFTKKMVVLKRPRNRNLLNNVDEHANYTVPKLLNE